MSHLSDPPPAHGLNTLWAGVEDRKAFRPEPPGHSIRAVALLPRSGLAAGRSRQVRASRRAAAVYVCCKAALTYPGHKVRLLHMPYIREAYVMQRPLQQLVAPQCQVEMYLHADETSSHCAQAGFGVRGIERFRCQRAGRGRRAELHDALRLQAGGGGGAACGPGGAGGPRQGRAHLRVCRGAVSL